jgi:hypothetical protein
VWQEGDLSVFHYSKIDLDIQDVRVEANRIPGEVSAGAVGQIDWRARNARRDKWGGGTYSDFMIKDKILFHNIYNNPVTDYFI